MPARATRSKAKPLGNGKKKRVPATNSEGDESAREDDAPEDAYEDADDASEVESLDSDALDEDDVKALSRKRKRPAAAAKNAPAKNAGKKTSPKKAGASPRKKRKSAKDDEAEDEDYLELEEGQEVVGVVVQAPKTGRGTLNFCIRTSNKVLSDVGQFLLGKSRRTRLISSHS